MSGSKTPACNFLVTVVAVATAVKILILIRKTIRFPVFIHI